MTPASGSFVSAFLPATVSMKSRSTLSRIASSSRATFCFSSVKAGSGCGSACSTQLATFTQPLRVPMTTSVERKNPASA